MNGKTMATCTDCGAKLPLLGNHEGRCKSCYNKACYSAGEADRQMKVTRNTNKRVREKEQNAKVKQFEEAVANVMVTTETFCPDLKILERKGIITAEVAEGMNVFKDMAADWTGTFGGRSKTTQNTLRQVRETVIDELKVEAAKIGRTPLLRSIWITKSSAQRAGFCSLWRRERSRY